MGDMGDIWRAVKQASQIDRGQRLLQAGSEFEGAKALAEKAGLTLRQCSDTHYQLSPSDRSWHVQECPKASSRLQRRVDAFGADAKADRGQLSRQSSQRSGTLCIGCDHSRLSDLLDGGIPDGSRLNVG